MKKIKIISNPYKQSIQYKVYNENTCEWDERLGDGKLREENIRKCFLPFNVTEILEAICDEYYIDGKEPIEVIFEGTKEEYNDVVKVATEHAFENRVSVSFSNRMLENGKFILNDIKEVFTNIKPVIEEISDGDVEIKKNIAKVSDALDDIVPICVFGNYSTGKSTFINALIGREILPSGSDPITAKAFKIQNLNQSEIARIKFTHYDQLVELYFENGGYSIVKGDTSDPMLIELDQELKKMEVTSIDQLVITALSFINAYDRKDKTTLEIGNIIELSIPFAKTGILGNSNNKFVIFDTPGSNTASNDGHIQVLKEALEGFSNGIPVWVSTYDSIDTMDNEALCNNILSIDALDKRFTMIVINRADGAELPEKGFSENQIKNIMEFKSVEKMYASGIFFVSSIIGLGSKNDGKLTNRFTKRTYNSNVNYFSNREDENYMTLYSYNIMPSQIKKDIIDHLENEPNLIYVNSGLQCIESQMEQFASKYAAYNKCQMVYSFLSNVMEKTSQDIDVKLESNRNSRDSHIRSLEEKTQELILNMRKKSDELDEQFSNEALDSISTTVDNELNYNYCLEDLEEINQKYMEEYHDHYHVSDKKKVYEEAKNKMMNDFKGRVKELTFNNIKESLSGIVEDTKKGVESIYDSKKDLSDTQKDSFSETADKVLKVVNNKFKVDTIDAEVNINNIAYKYWEEKSQILKNELICFVTQSEALSEKQKQTLADLIFNYKNIAHDNQADDKFAKPKFLHGHVFGMDLFTFEKLNTAKLVKEYNKNIAINIEEIISDRNLNYYTTYKRWQYELSDIIEQHIIELSPVLLPISDFIDTKNRQIDSLELSQKKIKEALNEIEYLISFKSVV